MGVVDEPDICTAIQRHINRLEKWAKEEVMMFNKGKCQALQLRKNSLMCQDMLGADQTEGRLAEKHLSEDIKLNTHQQCTLASKKVNNFLGCTRNSFASRSREMILLCSALVKSIWCAEPSPELPRSRETDTLVHVRQSQRWWRNCSPVVQKLLFFGFSLILSQFLPLWLCWQ